MKTLIKVMVLIGLGAFFASCQGAHAKDPNRVIYGDDNRLDVYQANSFWQAKADATVALIKSSNLAEQGDGTVQIKGKTFGESFNLCKDEPFRDQPTSAFCSGSLIAPDIILSAGHCVRSKGDCKNTRFVFGFSVKSEGSFPSQVASSEVYSCKEIIRTEEQSNGSDFALLRLDRPVTNHNPLPIRRSGVVAAGDSIVVIGYPSGIPTKVSGGAQVRSINETYIVANLDTYGGNSGSAVFNESSGLVEGILVRGETDFVYKNGCRVSNVCPDTGCRGEDVTRIDRVWPYLQ